METNLLSRSGDLFLTGPIKKFLDTVLIGSYESGWYISNWSIMHMISGIIIGFFFKTYKNPYIYGLILHTIWEIWQILIGESKGHKKLTGKSGLIDTIVDTLFFLLGMSIYFNFSKFKM
jgi:hypothetical protein